MSSYDSLYPSRAPKPTVVVPDAFELVPSLVDILESVDAFGSALVSPAPMQVETIPGYVPAYTPPPQPTSVDRRRTVTGHVVSWHNQLVTAVRQRDAAASDLQEKNRRLEAANATIAKSELNAQRLEGELSTALHTIEQLQAEVQRQGQELADLYTEIAATRKAAGIAATEFRERER